MAPRRTSTSHLTTTSSRNPGASSPSETQNPSNSYSYHTTTSTRPRTSRRSNGRPSTARPRTGVSIIGGIEAQQIVCAVTESRGVAPTVGLAFVNLDTAESVLCQISDSQTYVRTVHKLQVYAPSILLVTNSAASPESKLLSIIKENLAEVDCQLEFIDRRYFAETTGLEYLEQLAFRDDIEAIKVAIGGNYFSVCCFAAALKYIDFQLGTTFPRHTLRIKYEPSEGSMMIDLATIQSLELIQNLQNHKSRDCLFGLLNESSTAMGARLLRSNILQPVTDADVLTSRFDAVEELASREEMFYATRQALKGIPDVDRILTALIIVPNNRDLVHAEQDINRVLALKEFVEHVRPVYESLSGASSFMLDSIRKLCDPDIVNLIEDLIKTVINEDVRLAKSPLELRNQRVYAVNAGVNGLLDVSRVTYREAVQDAYQHMKEVNETHGMEFDLRFENSRQFYLRIPASDVEHHPLPSTITNVIRRKQWIECSTLDLMKLNQKISDAHNEVLLMSDSAIQTLIVSVRAHMADLFKICEGLAMLDMLSSFAHLATSNDYVRPQLGDTLAVQSCRHPIKEKLQTTKFVPNDVYATQNSRFQIITGCNMSGKSTYIRTIALMTIMAQLGSFVPATFATFPIMYQLFARTSMDDIIEANVSTFATEMRETAFILRNINRRSLAIIDELGRGTSTRDGLAIAIAIAEALVDSRALVWFATHFGDLAKILGERPGVINLHLAVDIFQGPQALSDSTIGGRYHHDRNAGQTITMKYKISQGHVKTTHYGLALAQLVPLPATVLDTAERVARHLEQVSLKKKTTSNAVRLAKRRRLILGLKEHLEQAQSGGLEGEVLKGWLKELQKEFLKRMAQLDELVEATDMEMEEDETMHSVSHTTGSFVDV